MVKNFSELKSGAFHCYQMGRLKSSLWALIPALFFGFMGVVLCSSTMTSLSCAGAIGALSVFGLWKGQDFGKAIIPSLVLGLVAVIVPATAHLLGFCCTLEIELAVCIGTGLILGFIHGYAPARNPNLGKSYLISGILIISLSGIIGCSYLGLTGLIGVSIGVILSSLTSYCLLRKGQSA